MEEHTHFLRSTCLPSQGRAVAPVILCWTSPWKTRGPEGVWACVVPAEGGKFFILFKIKKSSHITKSNMVRRSLRHYNIFSLNLFSCKQTLQTKALLSNWVGISVSCVVCTPAHANAGSLELSVELRAELQCSPGHLNVLSLSCSWGQVTIFITCFEAGEWKIIIPIWRQYSICISFFTWQCFAVSSAS